MANISSYPTATPASGDLILGTQLSATSVNKTRNFTAGSITSAGLGYTSYVALLTQVGVASPTAKILQNTTGATLTWGRTSAGIFTLTSNAAIFTADKTIVFANPGNDDGATGDPSIIWARTSTTVLTITASAGVNSVLTDGSFEVRIYA